MAEPNGKKPAPPGAPHVAERAEPTAPSSASEFVPAWAGPATRATTDIVNALAQRIANRPARVRVKTSIAGALAGRLDVVVFELRSLSAAGLVIDRLVVRSEDVTVRPGLPPRLVTGAVGVKAVFTQASIDKWTKRARLPVRLELRSEGVVAHAGVGGLQMSEVLTELTPVGHFLQLRPLRASMFGVSAPMPPFFRGYLPLPPLPAGARLDRVEPADGELSVFLALEPIDEPLGPDLPRRLAMRLRWPASHT
jgi:hypothetical protein